MSDNTKRRQTVLDFSGGWEVRPQETHVGLADPYGRPKKQLGVTREPLTPHGLQSWVLVQVHRQESRLKVLNVTFVTNFIKSVSRTMVCACRDVTLNRLFFLVVAFPVFKSRKLLDFVPGQTNRASFTVIGFNCHISAVCANMTSNSVKKYAT